MADRGRDVVLRVVSDETKFDLSDVVDQLEDVSTESDAAATDLEAVTDELKRLALQGQDAQAKLDDLNREANENKFDELGKDARAAATKVDAAFEAMEKSARTAGATIERESDETFTEVKDEARANLSEVASSFQGDMTSAIDLVQGTLGGLAASIPGIGTAIAAVGAIGVGILAGMFQKAQEAAEAARQAAADYYGELVSGQGRVDQASAVQKVLEDEDGQLNKNLKTAQKYAIASSDVVAALAGDAEARERVTAAIAEQTTALQSQIGADARTGQNTQARVKDLNDLRGAIDKAAAAQVGGTAKYELGVETLRAMGITLDTTTTAYDGAREAANDYHEVLPELNHDLEGFTEPAQIMIGLLDEQKTKADEAGKQFRITATDVKTFLASFAEQVTAQENFTNNLRTLAKHGVAEGFIDELEAQGPAAAAAVQALTKATPAQVKQINALYDRQGKDAGDSWKTGLGKSKEGVRTTAAGVHTAAKTELGKPIPIKVTPPPAPESRSAAEEALRVAQEYADTHPIRYTGKVTIPPPASGKRVI